MPLFILATQTIFFWFIVILLYRVRSKFTLIPLYSYLAILTILTHNLSDLGFSIVYGKWFFLIGSVSLFTTLMFATLFLYLFEGSRATRIALGVILGASFFYIFIVYILQLMVDTSAWVQLNFTTGRTYFWSMLAIVVDVFMLTIIWELLSKIKSLNLLARVFLVIFSVLIIDTLIFTTGVFVDSGFYFSVLSGNLLVRLALSILAAPIITLLLKSEGFVEAKRTKPQNFWEILNFRSDLEVKISNLEEIIKKNKFLEDKLKLAAETYELVINGSGAGVWDWDVLTNQVIYSEKFCKMLGYKIKDLKSNLDAFKAILHPDDLERTFDLVNKCFANGSAYEVEYRLKSKSGKYRWFLASGTVKYDEKGQPIRMVGSIIDIDAKKQNEIKIEEKIKELSALNNTMINRELKMVELKNKISQLEKNKKN